MLSSAFQFIPVNQRLPLFYVEIDPSRAGSSVINEPAILFGHPETGNTNTTQIHRLTNRNAAASLFGPSSMLASMDRYLRKANPTVEVLALAVPEPATGQRATGTITINSQATAAGTLFAYINGERYQVGVSQADTVSDIAANLAQEISDDPLAAVTASATLGVVTIQAKWRGATGNDIDLRFNHLGLNGGESFPPGLTVTVAPMSGGTGFPDLDNVPAVLADTPFDHAGWPWTDTASLNFFRDIMRDATGGRWAWDKQLYGGGWAVRRGTVSEIGTFGNTRNDPHISIMHSKNSPTAPWNHAASYAGRAVGFLTNDPVAPLHTGVLNGVLAPSPEDRYETGEANILLFDGISTFYEGADNQVRISRALTTYQTSPAGADDTAFLDVNTPYTLARFNRHMRGFVERRYARHGIVNDGTRFQPGLRRVTPSQIKADLVGQYALLEQQGLVENIDLFTENLIVERNQQDPTRVDVLAAPDLANGLQIFALLNQFRLQFDEAA